MTKVRKLKRKKRFRANINRKRLRNKLNKLPNIECKQVKESWEATKSIVKNLTQMGLVYDPNKVLAIPSMQKKMLKIAKDNEKEDEENETKNTEENIFKKLHVVQNLEAEARHPRAKLFRLPNNEVQFATYMIDKYADDYKAMVRDRKNYNQLTWRQIKAKIDRFKSVPEQYAEYLVKKGEIVLDDPTPLQNPKKMKQPTLIEPITNKTRSTKLSRRKRQKKASLLETIWQEESIVQDDLTNEFHTEKSVRDDKEDLKHKDTNEKKLQLFPDDIDGDENDEDGSEITDTSDETDSEEESEEEKSVGKNKNLKSVKNTKVKNNKKLKVR